MNILELYPNTHHFILLKELPGAEIGDHVNIAIADGRECLYVKEIEFPIWFANKYPDWFKPVSNNDHELEFMVNSVRYIMLSKKKTLKEAIELFNKIE